MTGDSDPSYRTLVAVLLVAVGALAGFTAGWFVPHPDSLVGVPGMRFTNTFPDYRVVCSARGSRSSFSPAGDDLRIGDRLVRDCSVINP